MAYSDAMRDRVTLERRSNTTDGGFGQDSVWVSKFSFRCRMRTLSSRELFAYRREGYTNVMRIEAEDTIRRWQNKDGKRGTSLRDYMQHPELEHVRLVHHGVSGARTFNPVGVVRPMEGLHDTAQNHVWIDCVETPILTGQMDA